jgi:hypothetical protein
MLPGEKNIDSEDSDPGFDNYQEAKDLGFSFPRELVHQFPDLSPIPECEGGRGKTEYKKRVGVI